ncbi:MAG: hypothetical protein GC205_00520 [Bacteroidetes bacterium]|nr:hypothetical protein [Bacteroidota bacterium]
MSASQEPKEFTEVLRGYIQTNLELAKLEIVERGSVIGTAIFSGVVIAVFGLLALALLSIGASFYFGQLFGDIFAGFALVSGFYLLLAGVLFLFRKRIVEKTIRDKILHELLVQQ